MSLRARAAKICKVLMCANVGCAGELAQKLIGVTGSMVTLEFKRTAGEQYAVELVREPVNGLQSPS